MKRTAVNPSDWGLRWSLNQGEVIEGVTRHLHCSGQVALESDADSEMGSALWAKVTYGPKSSRPWPTSTRS